MSAAEIMGIKKREFIGVWAKQGNNAQGAIISNVDLETFDA
jgi:hypothetical protein